MTKSSAHFLGPLLIGLAATAMAAAAAAAMEPELSGRVGYELRVFAQEPLYPGQSSANNSSVFVEPELYWQWNNSDDSLVFKPFVRADEHDSQRSHADIRELMWTHVADEWELRTGIGKVFWGVTEFQHLVDVINQTDGVEDIDGEEKLGQQMVNLSLVRDWGVLDLFLLPGFRERTFAGSSGRLRGPLVVDTDNARYQSSAGKQHLDAAFRWSHTLGDYDFGIYGFHGTNRDPVLTQQGTMLVPFYEQMDQFGIDLQATLGEWLWKFESIYRDSHSGSFVAFQGGFEYTLIGIMESAVDLGLLIEYGKDSRGQQSMTVIQNDAFFGARLTLNDAQSSELLAGMGQDLDHGGYSLLVEASRRLGDSWKLSLDARLFNSDERSDPLYALRQDDLVQLVVERYF